MKTSIHMHLIYYNLIDVEQQIKRINKQGYKIAYIMEA
jgi:hypothetical protein